MMKSQALNRAVMLSTLAAPRRLVCCALLVSLAVSCTGRGNFPHSTGTSVDLSRNNYRVIKSNVVGSSWGFWLLGIIPFTFPSYTSAMSDLYDKANIEEGGATALVNVVEEKSYLYLILFGIPKLKVRADIIEFVGEGAEGSYPDRSGRQNRY